MVIQQVKFKSALSGAEARLMMEQQAPHFRNVPGLVQKYFAHEEATGELCGIYLFDSDESLAMFRESELARTIPAVYKAETTRVETYELLFPLHADRGVPTRLAT